MNIFIFKINLPKITVAILKTTHRRGHSENSRNSRRAKLITSRDSAARADGKSGTTAIQVRPLLEPL